MRWVDEHLRVVVVVPALLIAKLPTAIRIMTTTTIATEIRVRLPLSARSLAWRICTARAVQGWRLLLTNDSEKLTYPLAKPSVTGQQEGPFRPNRLGINLDWPGIGTPTRKWLPEPGSSRTPQGGFAEALPVVGVQRSFNFRQHPSQVWIKLGRVTGGHLVFGPPPHAVELFSVRAKDLISIGRDDEPELTSVCLSLMDPTVSLMVTRRGCSPIQEGKRRRCPALPSIRAAPHLRGLLLAQHALRSVATSRL